MSTKRYIIFVIAFMLMHFVGLAMTAQPYWVNACVTSLTVLSAVLLLEYLLLQQPIAITLSVLGFRTPVVKTLIPGALVSMALLLCYPILGVILSIELRLHEDWWLNGLGLLLTAGLMEEMVFRGYVFGQLREKKTFRNSVLLSMLIFTIAHLLLFIYFEWPVAFMSTILAVGISIPLSYLFEKTGNSVWSPAMVHITVRTIGMVVVTQEASMMKLTLIWMLLALVIPFIVLGTYGDFRKLLYPNISFRDR